ncbi:MAG TPA: hypothetical protein VI299_09470 [Polyangiales bacterium]
MTTHRTSHESNPIGRSRFAKRGQSSEERMPDDDSADKFASEGAREEGAREGWALDGRVYGSGGSYGYGGAFEHGGQRGYEVSFAQRAPVGENEEPYQATGGFGHDTDGYSRAGIGHPGKDEQRPAEEVGDGAPASGHPSAEDARREDARRGYSQESGYVQSGGNPAPDGQETKRGSKKKVSRKSN